MNTFRVLCAVGSAAAFVVSAGCNSRVDRDHFHEGLEALGRGRFVRAERLLLDALSEYPDNAAVAAHLATAQWKRGSLDNAVASMRLALKSAPDDQRILAYLGFLLLKARNDHAALTVLDSAVAQQPDRPDLLTALAVARWRLGDTVAAHELLNRVISSHADYAPAVYNMAVLLRDQRHDGEQAQLYFERYLALNPSGERVDDARRALARQQRSQTESRHRTATVLRSPFESSSPQLLNRAQAAMQRGDFDEAYIHLLNAVRHDENDAHAYWTMADFIDLKLQATNRAVQAWQDFLNLFPDDPRASDVRRRLRQTSPPAPSDPGVWRDLEAGEATLPRLTFTPRSRRDQAGAERAFERGLQFLAAGDWNRAIYHFTLAIEQDDSQINAFLQLARAYESNGDPALAVDAYGYALRLHPGLIEPRLQSARLLIRLGGRSQAAAQLEIVLRQDPQQAEAHLLMGLLMRDQPEMLPAARRHLRKYLELSPEGEIANRVRRWLDT